MTFNKQLLTAAFLTVGGLTAMSSANAADSDTFTVTTTIDASCSVVTDAANIDFGTITANTAAADGTITNKITSGTGIAVTCSSGSPYAIKLATLSNPDSTIGEGVLKGTNTNAQTIAYKLGSTSTGTAWGSLETNDVTGTGTGLSTPISHLVYASITGSTDVKEDTYTDTITASITY